MRRDVGALIDGTFDLLVVGGGITGAGVALDAALRGLRTALIDKGDFAGGTSSASSKLVHGGLRYLEHGKLGLVRQALRERALLLRNAPHLVRPLRFLLPFYQGARVPRWKWRIGLTVYDLLAGRGNLARSRPLTARDVSRQLPGLRRAGLLGAAEYHDAQMDDARLCLEVIQSAAGEGARVCNYIEAAEIEAPRGRPLVVRALDRLTGRPLSVSARQVVNAAGPWVDEVCRRAGERSEPRLEPTKGIHLLAPGRGLPAALLLLHPADGRVFFIMPWMGKTLVGTTDTLTVGPPDESRVEPADVSYLLNGFNHYLEPALGAAELCGSLAGLRPLLRSRADEPSAKSREFRLFHGPAGMISVAGGKYTTFRHMAEVVTDAVVRELGGKVRTRTQAYRLVGTPRLPWPEFAPRARALLQARHALSAEAAGHLVGRYGRRAEHVARYVDHDPKLGEPVVAGEPDLQAELTYQRDHEMAVCPADHLLRRTRLGLFHPALLGPAG